MKNLKLKNLFSLIFVFGIAIVGIFLFSGFFAPNPKISVIVPVYKTEKYLNECLESIENQTFKDIEIVCVNDGSPDNSLEIMKNHKKKDVRIKIINQENGGISSARNAGINKARGEYIVFVDSDDIISKDLCEIAYESAKNGNFADIVQFKTVMFNDGEVCDFGSKNTNEEIRYLTREKSENPFEKFGLNINTVCDKLWKTSFIKENSLEFKKGMQSNEDVLFNILAYPLAKSSVINKSEKAAYGYRKNRIGAVTNSENTLRDTGNRYKMCEELLNQREIFNFDGGENWMMDFVFWCIHDSVMNHLPNKEDNKYFAIQGVEIINNYIKKYDYTLSKEQEKQYNDLKRHC